MKKIIEKDGVEGFEKLLGEKITVFACRYIYAGKLIEVGEDYILLAECVSVFQTGAFEKKEWDEYEKFPGEFYVQKAAIESYGILK